MSYKYFPVTRSFFFCKPMLRFTPINELNDPFECKSAFKAICSPSTLDKYICFKKTARDLGLIFPLKEICSEFDEFWDSEDIVLSEEKVRDANTARVESFMAKMNKKREKIGMLSLSATNNSPTMWAHYASEHRGFVVEFNMSHVFFAQNSEYDEENLLIGYDKTELENVFYVDKWIQEEKYNDILDLDSSFFYLYKSKQWEYEAEQRIIVHDANILNEYGIVGLIDCPPEAISGVYLGLKPSSELRNCVKAFCLRYPHIKAKKAGLSNSKHEIIFESL